MLPQAFDECTSDRADWRALRFWGLISQSQRDAFRRGAQVRIGALNRAAREALTGMLFGYKNGLVSRDVALARIAYDSHGFVRGLFVSRDEVVDVLRGEPTEAMPDGLPSSGSVVCDADAGYYVRAAPDETRAGEVLGNLGPVEFANFESRDDPNAARFAEAMERLLYGTRLTLTLSFNVAPDSVATRVLLDYQPPSDAVATREDLPAEFLSEVDAARLASKDSPIIRFLRGIIDIGDDVWTRPPTYPLLWR